MIEQTESDLNYIRRQIEMAVDTARLAMTTDLHYALFGEIWARPETPREVWVMMLERVRQLANAKPVGPDDFNCRKCGAPVRYANVNNGRIRTTFDAQMIEGGGYQLLESDEDPGEWVAHYVKVGERHPGVFGFRQHNCQARAR